MYCNYFVMQKQQESYDDSADIFLKFKVAGEHSGQKLKGFVVIEDGSFAFSTRLGF